ncbi:amidohydrolase family protein [Haloglomus salinum]|jgi:cytosine/adenosine deaminase-related metal-dependent hydrolase|uniref:amidohydrolase family protein n=1 Tax=Haloglomus salinum TaxID=2962673 RepID=UPI0020C9E304|nr:amidohydrolase family protein [Haloglomus salinum]
MHDTVIHGTTIVPVDGRNRIIENGTIVIEDGELVAVRPAEDDDHELPAETVIDGTRTVAIPGLVDAHRHTDFCLVGGLFADLDPFDALAEAIALYHTDAESLGRSFFEASWRLACLRHLTHGVTTVNAMDGYPAIGARAVGESGLRAIIGLDFSDLVMPASVSDQVAEIRAFIDEYHGSYDGRVQASLAPDGTGACSREAWEATAVLREEYPELLLHTHAFNVPYGAVVARGTHGNDRLGTLDDLGLLDDRTVIAHCTHADTDDVRRIADTGASVVHCASIFSYYRAEQRDWYPVESLRDAGVPIGLGLDDPGWFGSWDLFREASRARLLANYEYGAHQYHSRDLLRMLTIDGARTLGLDDRVGSLEVGKRADVLLLDVDSPTHQPLYNLPAAIVNTVTAGDVETVVVDGEILIHDGEVRSMDVSSVLTTARQEFDRFLQATGWDATLGSSRPPESSLWRRVSPAVIARYARQALRGVGPTLRAKL